MPPRTLAAPAAPAARGTPREGARFGPYELLRPLGHGATGSVHEAIHVALDRPAAIKVLHAHLTANEAAASRFLREGRAASRIDHPHVLEVFDVGYEGDTPYLVMALIHGDPLSRLFEAGPMALEAVADLFVPIASAVWAAHRAGVVHRDLKPSNILVTRGPKGAVFPKVVDFGISKLSWEGEATETGNDALLGTLNYMAPEQARTARGARAASDQFALGLLLYQAATNVLPFVGFSAFERATAIGTIRVAPPSELVPALPRAFDALVARALEADPARRFGSLGELGAALLPFASSETRVRWGDELAASSTSCATPAPATRMAIPSPPVRAVAAGALALAISVAAFVALRPPAPTPAPVAPAGTSTATSVALPEPLARTPRSATESAAIGAPAANEVGMPSPSRVLGANSTAAAAAAKPSGARRSAGPHLRAPAPTSAARAMPERGENGAMILE